MTDAPPLRARSVDAELEMDVREAVRHLPPNYRCVIRLYYAAEVPIAQIADMLGKPEGTVRRWLSEAYTVLRKTLGPLED
jgi:RNA polymerase sigma-70 factor (ECF subfamily)